MIAPCMLEDNFLANHSILQVPAGSTKRIMTGINTLPTLLFTDLSHSSPQIGLFQENNVENTKHIEER